MGYKGLVGQSAIEYLMTYGWMLLVVAVTGGAIFATVGDQGVETTSGFDGDITIDNFGVSNQDELGLEVRDSSGQGITVSKVNISDPDTDQWIYKEFTGENRVGVGSSKIFELPNVTRADSGNELEVEILYDSEGLSNLSEEGTINGQLELNNTGSFEGLPEDEHQSIENEDETESTADPFTVNYEPQGSIPYNIDVSGNDTIGINISGSGSQESGYSNQGGVVIYDQLNVSNVDQIDLYVALESESLYDAGRENNGDRSGGAVTILRTGSGKFIAAADGAGGSEGSSDFIGAAGGSRGGESASGYQDSEGTGFGGRYTIGFQYGAPGAGEVNTSFFPDIEDAWEGFPEDINESVIGSGDRPSGWTQGNVSSALPSEDFNPDQHVIGVGHGNEIYNGSAEITFNAN